MSRHVVSSFDALQVRQEINTAVGVVRKSLDATRNPQHPADVPHTYDDKFRIVELASRAALAVQLNTLAAGFGLTPEKVQALQKARGNKTVSLRLTCSTECTFTETRTREEESATRLEKQGVFGKTTYQSVTTITEHFWDYSVQWELSAVVGTGQHTEPLLSRSGNHTIMTRAKEAVSPLPQRRALDPLSVEITWLLDACKSGSVDFSIDRADATQCHTPRRNAEVDRLLTHASRLTTFCNRVKNQVERTYRDGYSKLLPEGAEQPNLSVVDANVFAPVTVMLALEESNGEAHGSEDVSGGGAAEESPASLFSAADFEKILEQQSQELEARFGQIREVLPSSGVVTPVEANVVVCAGYSMLVWRQYNNAVQAVEDMLMQQLIAAIGQRIGPADFAKYMAYHNRQLYLPEFAPRGFCYAVRRPDHYPEGVLSLEDGADDQPIPTTCLHREQGHTMKFALNAATEVAFEGEHYVHSVVFHKFSNSSPPRLSLIARARQFSSFILLAGSLSSADVFQPEHALIIQNKDELKIPLILETIPAPQEFRDAIESLSPEQQAFCKAYRKMQLAGSLFAVAVVQIKPQLERLLNLPHDALTKEVKMCQDLMSLFIEYQIPSDLLAYAGPEGASAGAKVTAVKGYIGNIMAMLDTAKKEELEEEERRYKKNHPISPPQPSIDLLNFAPTGASAMDMLGSFDFAGGGGGGGGGAGGGLPFPGGAPPPPPAAAAAQQQQQQQQQQQRNDQSLQTSQAAPISGEASSEAQPAASSVQQNAGGSSATAAMDYTQLPRLLDSNFDKYDKFNSLRATIVTLGSQWKKTSQRGLLSKPSTCTLGQGEQRTEMGRAADLLDALSKSGALSLVGCSLHVITAATHCFDLDLLNTVVQDNINPIDRVEASGLIMASTIFQRAPRALVRDPEAQRIEALQLSDQ